MKTKQKFSMTEGSIVKAMIAFTVPLMIGQFFQEMYNTTNALIVGIFLGSEELAAVTSTGSLINLFIGFFNGTSVGAGVIIATFYGAKNYKNLKASIHTNIAFSILCAIIVTIVGIAFTPQILEMMGTPDDVLVYAVKYLRVYFAGSVGVVLYNMCRGTLQAVGDSKHPLYYLVISSCTNIVLTVIFCGVLRLGVEYAALSTVISQMLSVCLCMHRLTHTNEIYKVEWKEIRLTLSMLKRIITVGLPMGIQNSVTAISNVIIQSSINAFGTLAMAGSGAHAKIEAFVFLPVTCFTMTLTTFVGQNLGAKKYERVKKGSFFGVVCLMILTELVGIFMYIFAPRLISMFDSSPKVVGYGTIHMRTVCLFYFLMAFSHGVSAILRGTGKSIVPMGVIMFAWCGFRMVYVSIATKLFEGIQAVFWVYPISWALSAGIFLLCILKVNWMGIAKE